VVVTATAARASNTGRISLRDPAGQLFLIGGRFLRVINREAAVDLKAFLASTTARNSVGAGRLVGTEVLSEDAIEELRSTAEFKTLCERFAPCTVVEHEAVPFTSFAYEWPAAMLHAAAELTLDLAESSLDEGFGLKDATPYNLLFRGPEPVFVDLLSFERRNPGDAIWLPYAQFMRAFILPLLANRYLHAPLDQILIARRDGLEPEALYAMCGPLRRLLPPFLTLASIPTWLGRRHDPDDLSIYQAKPAAEPRKARFILASLFRHLRRTLKTVRPQAGKASRWSDYMARQSSYSDQDFEAKRDFIQQALRDYRPGNVLDVGCNTGYYSRLAAGAGARVVAIDPDRVVIDELWRGARAERLDILPLVVDFTRPTPAIGWRNQECPSFLDRARGAFDAVLMLAVIHHMLVSERIPLPEILALTAELTTDIAVVEFVGPQDPMFRRIARGRDGLFADFSVSSFEAECRRHFRIIGSRRLANGNRGLYLLRKERGC